MPGAEPLAGAVDCRERLDRSVRAIPGLDRLQAGIAIAAAALMCLAEMGKDRLPPASRSFADPQQGVELGTLDALDVITRGTAVDHPAALDDIGHAIGHPRIRRQAVAAGAAGFLVIGLDGARQVEMRDIAHIRLVYAHAEGDGGDEAQVLLLQEGVLVGVAHRSEAHTSERQSLMRTSYAVF